jgi:hypothetical protein
VDRRYSPEAFFRVKAEYVARELERSAVGRAVWIWGAGRQTRKRVEELEKWGVRIAGFVDVDAKKWTHALGGKGVPVIGPERVGSAESVVVLTYVSVRGARDFIRGELRKKGFVDGRDFWACA